MLTFALTVVLSYWYSGEVNWGLAFALAIVIGPLGYLKLITSADKS